jgi:3-oxoisoapionate kinase
VNITGPVLSYLGDDFTGSTDVMEAFTAAGVPTVLFLKAPDADWVARFSHMRCIGLATTARSQNPEWMDKNLPDYFLKLKAFGAPILQYKVCSTFDSAPRVGSIGKALDIGREVFGYNNLSPIVVGVPQLKRYTAFGHLFAAVNGVNYRIDRSPTMSKHPVTPMLESDLRKHLADQTKTVVELFDTSNIQASKHNPQFGNDLLSSWRGTAVLIDVMSESDQAEVGRLVWESRGEGLFSASSSGLQYALVAYWRSLRLLPEVSTLPKAEPASAIAVVSGSCSPVTAEQIDRAGAHGFTLLRMNIDKVLDEHSNSAEIERLTSAANDALLTGISPLVYSAKGPFDVAVVKFDSIADKHRLTRSQAAEIVGQALGQVMKNVVDANPLLKRLVVAGGDSSGCVIEKLDIEALTIHAGIAPGVPLCRAWSKNAKRDGLQISLKAGQLGGLDFFEKALAK